MSRYARPSATVLACVVMIGALSSVAAPVRARSVVVTPPSAEVVLAQARKTAAAENKNIFVHFSASWCGWCHKLEAFLATNEGKLLTNHAVDVMLIVLESPDKAALNNPGAAEQMASWGGTGGIPFYVFLDANGKVLADANAMPNGGNIGYPANPAEVKAFESVLLKGIPKLSAADRATILEHITKHP